jgi:hypothetical protein
MLHSQLAREAGVPLASMPAEQLPTLPEPLHSHAHYMWLTSAVDVYISKLQADVSSALLVAGIPNSMEWLTDDGLFSIDIAFQVCWRACCCSMLLLHELCTAMFVHSLLWLCCDHRLSVLWFSMPFEIRLLTCAAAAATAAAG